VEIPDGSYFTLYEWPILQDPSQNGDVDEVLGIVGNTDATAPDGELTQIWPCGS